MKEQFTLSKIKFIFSQTSPISRKSLLKWTTFQSLFHGHYTSMSSRLHKTVYFEQKPLDTHQKKSEISLIETCVTTLCLKSYQSWSKTIWAKESAQNCTWSKRKTKTFTTLKSHNAKWTSSPASCKPLKTTRLIWNTFRNLLVKTINRALIPRRKMYKLSDDITSRNTSTMR